MRNEVKERNAVPHDAVEMVTIRAKNHVTGAVHGAREAGQAVPEPHFSLSFVCGGCGWVGCGPFRILALFVQRRGQGKEDRGRNVALGALLCVRVVWLCACGVGGRAAACGMGGGPRSLEPGRSAASRCRIVRSFPHFFIHPPNPTQPTHPQPHIQAGRITHEPVAAKATNSRRGEKRRRQQQQQYMGGRGRRLLPLPSPPFCPTHPPTPTPTPTKPSFLLLPLRPPLRRALHPHPSSSSHHLTSSSSSSSSLLFI